jgi:6-phosphogluconolactonase (cycloisomerase 2 family)
MTERPIRAWRGLYVAGRGSSAHDGLHRFVNAGDGWQGSHLAVVDQLATMAWHPSLPVIYGASGVGDGIVHAWDVSGESAVTLAEVPSGGVEPCHIIVDPGARMLVVTNYQSGTVAVWLLSDDGSLVGDCELTELSGSSIDPDRQEASHPHQAIFSGDTLYIVDLGADVVHTFTVASHGREIAALTAAADLPVPAGTGPRHLVVLPNGDVALSGELASSALTGRPDGPSTCWRVTPSTTRTGPAQTRTARNYPGDIESSVDGRFVYLANRGYDTIGTFFVGAGEPQFMSETDTGVKWPQHLLVDDDELIIAGWDSGLVVSMPLLDGVPGDPIMLFECSGAGWLLPGRL